MNIVSMIDTSKEFNSSLKDINSKLNAIHLMLNDLYNRCSESLIKEELIEIIKLIEEI